MGDSVSIVNLMTTAAPGFTTPDVASGTNLVFRLQVAASNTVVGSVLAATGNLPPVTDDGSDQALNGGVTVILDARCSSDPDDLSLSLSWRLISGAGVSLQQESEPGTSSMDQVTITVLNTDALHHRPVNASWTLMVTAYLRRRISTVPTTKASITRCIST